MAGTHTVRRTVSGPNGSDTRVIPNLVSVAPGLAISLEITPSQATVAVQESIEFNALALDEFGNGVAVMARWLLAADEGTLDNDGTCAAGTRSADFANAITATFRTSAGELTALASVKANPGPVTAVTLSDYLKTL